MKQIRCHLPAKSVLLPLLVGVCLLSQTIVPVSVQAEPAVTQPEQAALATAIGGCQMFPSNNIWNARVDSLPVDDRSSQWISTIGSTRRFHMDFGSGVWDGGPIGIPYNVVGSGVPKVPVSFDYEGESDPGPYPIPSSPLQEYGSDGHILIVDTSTCKLYELYAASKSGGQWSAGSGAIWDLNSNALRPAGWTSADAAGLPILPGLVRYDEIASGEIDHAIRFTAENTNDYIWPARHLTSDNSNTPQIPPMGARFRLKASYDISGYPAEMQVILRAMKKYGLILADNGSNWYISGAPDARWDNDMLHLLDALTGNDFEAVNTSGLMVDVNSGATGSGVPGPVSEGVYDDTNFNWVYSGSWTAYSGSGPLNNTARYSRVAGSEARLDFNGNRFTFTYVKASNRGLIDVYVDGSKIGQINAKSSTTAWQQTWTSPVFATGEHTVRFVHAGGGTYIDVDAIQIFAPSDLVAPGAIGDLTATTGTTTGTIALRWTAPGDDGSTGTAASYLVRYSSAAITGGNWDAATPVTSGLPAPAVAGTIQNMLVSGLTPGTLYFFAVRAQDEEGNLGGVSNSPSAAAQSITPVPAGNYDDAHVNWLYSGSWTTYNGAGPANNTSHYSGTVGSEAQITIDGAKFKLTYVKASNRGSIDVYVDGAKITRLNAYSAGMVWQATWTSPDLTPGVHVVRFVHAGGRTYIDIDAIQVFAPPPTVPAGGPYDDVHAAWIFSSGWTSYTGTGPLNNTSHYTNVVGRDVQLTFTGTGFTFTYVKASNRGLIDVYVDGTKVGQINAKSTSTLWQQTWSSSTLSPGTHTVRFVHAGGGTYIDVDAITIR